MADWIHLLHLPRADSAATMAEDEEAVRAVHFARRKGSLADGTLVLAGPALGSTNTDTVVIEAPDEESAGRLLDEHPAVVGGFARGEPLSFRVSLLRGRD